MLYIVIHRRNGREVTVPTFADSAEEAENKVIRICNARPSAIVSVFPASWMAE